MHNSHIAKASRGWGFFGLLAVRFVTLPKTLNKSTRKKTALKLTSEYLYFRSFSCRITRKHSPMTSLLHYMTLPYIPFENRPFATNDHMVQNLPYW